ncbi:hypothetical protein D3C71_181830 [compost metagenome]
MFMDWTDVPRPPLRTQTVSTKSINLDDLAIGTRAVFEEVFGAFFSDPASDPRQAEFIAAGIAIEPAFNLRRFSAGAALSRGRYATLCDGTRADSGQALAMEVLAYASIDGEREVRVFDMSDPAADSVLSRQSEATRTSIAAVDRRALLIERVRLAYDPLITASENSDVYESDLHLVVPYRLQQRRLENVLDLRERDAMKWLLRVLWEFFPGAAFDDKPPPPYAETLQATGSRGPLVVSFGAIPDGSDNQDLDALLKEVGYRNVGLKNIAGHDWPLVDCLSYMRHRALGGTVMDDLIASCAIRCGAKALIYPSVRHDCSVRYRGNRVEKWSGFNLVDYEGYDPPVPPSGGFLVASPAFWQGGDGAMSIPPLTSDPYAVDDWAVHGSAALTRARHRAAGWGRRLAGQEMPLPIRLHLERTPWRGVDGRPWGRKGAWFETSLNLRLALLSGEVQIGAKILDSIVGDVSVSPVLGAHLAALSERLDLWGHGLARAVYPAPSWCLIRDEISGAHVLCPGCGYLSKPEPSDVGALTHCRVCFAGAELAQDERLAKRALNAVIFAIADYES